MTGRVLTSIVTAEARRELFLPLYIVANTVSPASEKRFRVKPKAVLKKALRVSAFLSQKSFAFSALVFEVIVKVAEPVPFSSGDFGGRQSVSHPLKMLS